MVSFGTAAGLLWCAYAVDPESQDMILAIQSMQEDRQKEQEVSLVWFELPEYGVKVKITPQEKVQYNEISSEVRKRGERLVWYKVPELGIEFLVAPGSEKDLKYTVSNASSLGYGIIGVDFYLQSLNNFMEECVVKQEFNGNTSYLSPVCQVFALTRISSSKLDEYDIKAVGGHPFCGLMNKHFVVGQYDFCAQHSYDMWLGFDQKKLNTYYHLQSSGVEGYMIKTSRMIQESDLQ